MSVSCQIRTLSTSVAPLDDDVSPCALDDGHDLGPLGRRDCELVKRLRHVVHERVPLARRDGALRSILSPLMGWSGRAPAPPASEAGIRLRIRPPRNASPITA